MLVKALASAGSLLQPPTSERLKSGYVILKAGEQVGEHTSDGREEMLIILSGTAWIECEGESAEVVEHSVVYIPKNALHNVFNRSQSDLQYLYVVTPVS